jgi:hypothetical protein
VSAARRVDLTSGLPGDGDARPWTLTEGEYAEYQALRAAAIDALLGHETEVTTAGVPTALIGPPRRPEPGYWWFPPPRTVFTGHRVAVGGRVPAESRTLPWWTWGFEVLWRVEARLMRGQPQHVRDGLVPDPAAVSEPDSSTTEVY